MAGENARFSGDPIVKLETDVVVAGVEPVEARNQEFETAREIRPIFQHENSFVQSAIDDVIFRRIKFLNRFFEVTNSTMNDFRGFARSGAGKIPGFDEYGL